MTGGPVSETAGREGAAGWRSELAGLVAGPVETATTPGYELECDAFDRAVPQRPAIVVGAAAEPDIVAAVRFGQDHGLGVGVLATGHGLTVPVGGGLLIGTRRLGEVTVDAAARTARVAAGATWASVVTQAARSGLAPLCGSAPGVGAVSYTLGGGLGPLGRRYGFAADQVRQIDLVTADGEVRQVTPESYPDLFWAARGGGGNFGIATSLVVGLFPVAEIYGGGLYLPGEAAAEVLRAFLACAREAPDELTLSAAVMTFPPSRCRSAAAARPVRLSCPGVVLRRAGGGRGSDPAAAQGGAAAARHGPGHAVHRCRHHPQRPDHPDGHHEPDPGAESGRRPDGRHAAGPAGPGAPFLVEIRQMGGALGRPPPVPNAVGHRDGAFNMYATAYPNPAGLHQAGEAEQRLVDALEPWSDGGALVNFLAGPHVTPDHVRAAYAADDYQRLVRTKNSWDPGNTFRFNHNIPPGRT